MGTIFISHASADKELVDGVVDLLETGAGVKGGNIYASSVEGRDTPPGVKYRDFVREQLSSAAVVLLLLTPEYYRSPFCMAELGGAWMLEASAFVFVAPPLERDDIRDVFGDLQIEELDKAKSLDKLLDFLLHHELTDDTRVARWNAKRATFIKSMKKVTTTSSGPDSRSDRGRWTKSVVDGTIFIADGYATMDLKSTILQDIEAGGVLPTVYAYLTNFGYRNWISLTEDPGNVYFNDAIELYKSHSTDIAKSIVDAVGSGLDIISLGPGNGRKDLLLLRSLARLGDAGRLYYYPFDVNEGMIATSMRLVGGDKNLKDVSVKAILAEFDALSQFKYVYQYRRAPNVFLFLGNTLGNLENEVNYLERIKKSAMVSGDLLVLEVRNQRLRSDPEQDLGAEDRNKRFDFGPLEFVGVPYSADDLAYEVLENRSVVPGTHTTVATYKGVDLDDIAEEEVTLSYIHRYNGDALTKICTETVGFTLLNSVERGSSTALVLQKP